MKRNNLLLVLIVVGFGLFLPYDVFAEYDHKYIYNNVVVDYRFSVLDENNKQMENLDFKLYDKSGSLQFHSEYDSDTNEYFFLNNEYNYGSWELVHASSWNFISPYDESISEDSFRGYVKYSNEIMNIEDEESCTQLMSRYHLHGRHFYSQTNGADEYCGYYDYIPLILEETSTGNKKIVLASYRLYLAYYSSIWDSLVGVYFINHSFESDILLLSDIYNGTVEDNIQFMRNAVYDYSDELWEQLNNGPVASSELNLDDSSVVMGGNGANDLTKPSVIQFSKKSNTNQDTNPKEKTIVDVITNPKTWNNGVMILFVSLIVIVGSSLFIVKKKV